MNSRFVSVLCLAAAVSTAALAPLSAASKNDHPFAYPVGTVYLSSDSGSDPIARGTSRTAVSELLGSPLRMLSPDVWVYGGFRANVDPADDKGCSMLIVTFVHGEVADLKLVNRPAIGLLASNSHPRPAQRYASTR